MTLLFDLETKIEILEKKVDTIGKKESEDDTIDKESQSLPEACSNNSEEIKCEVCDFTAKKKFGLRIHFHKNIPWQESNVLVVTLPAKIR